MARRVKQVEFDGPFFTADLTKTARENVGHFLDLAAAYGEAEAKRRVWGAPRRTAGPSYSGSFIRGRVRARSGRRWLATAVVSADVSSLGKAGAMRVQAALAGRHNPIDKDGFNIGTTKGHEGTAKVFSGTASALRRIVKELDLTKGLD